MKKTLLTLAVAASLATAAQAQLLTWNTTGAAGNEASLSANFTSVGILGGSLTRGAGLNAVALANSFNSTGFNMQATDYISFSFTVDTGYVASFTGIAIGTRSSGTAPQTLGLYYSGDSFTTPIYTFTQGNATFLNTNVSFASALTGLTGFVEFRIIPIGTAAASGSGNYSATGAYRITDYFEGSTEASDITFMGSVVAVPEPHEYAVAMAGLLLAVVVMRRRRTC